MDPSQAKGVIVPSCILGLAYAYYNYRKVNQVQIIQLDASSDDELLNESKKNNSIQQIGEYIQIGSKEFLFQEYKFLSYFMSIFAFIVFIAVDCYGQEHPQFQIYTTFAFLCGGITSTVSGYIGMQIATHTNTKVAYVAQSSLSEAFKVAYRAGCVMGFSLTSLGLLVLTIILSLYRACGIVDDSLQFNRYETMMEAVAGYGLGGSTVALFARVGGGIYTKAADVGADLVGKMEHDLPEDSPKNPATIADNVGDNVGDIAGMGADLFGSFAEATCAALVVLSSLQVNNEIEEGYLWYPLLITAYGILGSFLTSFAATSFMTVDQNEKIEKTLKWQLIISTVILTPLLYIAAHQALPQIDEFENFPQSAFVCTLMGLWGGLLIGAQTEYMTSFSYSPVMSLVKSCETGAATNIISGLALGYESTILPVIILSCIIYTAFSQLDMLGIALSALGMLSNLPISLAIDAYGPISDNAGGIAEMAELGEVVRARTDALDAAGNTTAAIGKGFAIGSAALVSLSLYGAFVTRCFPDYTGVIVVDKMVFSCLLIGAMLPYWFSAMTMKSVGKAAQEMVTEVRRQLRDEDIKNGTKDPDFRACIRISTAASLREMVGPGLLVVCTPIFFGFFFGVKAVAGILPGSLISAVQMAISSSNSGGAWDNAKKYFESRGMKGTEDHKAAVVGDTVGDPLKDTSGPSLNILMKLMAILSLVFSDFFLKTSVLKKYL